MPKVSKQEIFNVDSASLFSVLKDYAKYPEFVDGVNEVEVLSENKKTARVQYTLTIIKKFTYILNLDHSDPHKLSWEFESGDIFKKNTGAWTLKDLPDGTTQVNYDIEVEFKLLVPQMIIKKLVEGNLPAMFKSYEERAQGVAKKKKK